MANLDRLMGLNGAVAAGEFTSGGELVSYQGDLSEETAKSIAQMCAANTLMGTTQAESFTRPYNPQGRVSARIVSDLALLARTPGMTLCA